MTEEGEEDHWKDWYTVVAEGDTALRQGDIFRDLPVFWLSSENQMPPENPAEHDPVYEARQSDWIVMTSSCDLAQRRCHQVLLAEVFPANAENLKADSEKVHKERVEVMRRGYDPRKFLLAECPAVDPRWPRSFAAFWNQVSMPLEYLEQACTEDRLRLAHPFREKFGNWVGKNFSEVGPEDESQIPVATDRLYSTHILRNVEE